MINYLKSYGYFLGIYVIFSFIVSILYYFDILTGSIYNIMELLIPLLSLFISSIILGKHSKEKGWLQGLKFGGILIILFFIIGYLGFDKGMGLKQFIYYLILLVATTIGGMVGISNVKK